MVELNNLRVLNDYLNQTIDVLLRSQRVGATWPGLSHSPYATVPFGTQTGIGIDPTFTAGLSHSPYTQGFGSVFPSAFPYNPLAAGGLPGVQPVLDPFTAQRGLNHTSIGLTPWSSAPWSPFAEIARQQQLTQAIVARQSVLEAMCRSAGIPV